MNFSVLTVYQFRSTHRIQRIHRLQKCIRSTDQGNTRDKKSLSGNLSFICQE